MAVALGPTRSGFKLRAGRRGWSTPEDGQRDPPPPTVGASSPPRVFRGTRPREKVFVEIVKSFRTRAPAQRKASPSSDIGWNWIPKKRVRS